MDKTKLEASAGELMELITKTTKDGVDFASEQAPLLFQEMIAYGRVFHTSLAIMCLLAIIVIVFASQKIYKKMYKETHDAYDNILHCLITVVPLIFPVMFGFMSFIKALQVWFAPRLYILNELKGLF